MMSFRKLCVVAASLCAITVSGWSLSPFIGDVVFTDNRMCNITDEYISAGGYLFVVDVLVNQDLRGNLAGMAMVGDIGSGAISTMFNIRGRVVANGASPVAIQIRGGIASAGEPVLSILGSYDGNPGNVMNWSIKVIWGGIETWNEAMVIDNLCGAIIADGIATAERGMRRRSVRAVLVPPFTISGVVADCSVYGNAASLQWNGLNFAGGFGTTWDPTYFFFNTVARCRVKLGYGTLAVYGGDVYAYPTAF
ncbi:MAG: hypothetical protein WCK47_03310 [bacterium]|nr:hypothetical protein [Candidatus Sumerlaeota bacterium]